MANLPLDVRPLTRDAFARYGDVIETGGRDQFPVNAGTSDRYHDLAHIDVQAEGGQPIVSIFRARPFALPLAIRMLERHPLSSQAFVPLSKTPFLIVVAPAKDDYSGADIRAFVTDGAQGVNYARGVWHHPLLALERVCDFLVIDRKGEGLNLEERSLECAVTIESL